jgi:hypothetical protein
MMLHRTIYAAVANLGANIGIAAQDIINRNPAAGTRSSRWPTVRKQHLKLDPKCRWCGGVDDLQVHHEKPFHDDPAQELNQANLITLCEAPGKDCHIKIGHCGNFKLFNPNVVTDCLSHHEPNPKAALPNVPGE